MLYYLLTILCLSVFCITGRKIATYSEVKNIFRFFLLLEKCRVSISQIYVRVPLTSRLQTKIYTTTFVKEQKIYPLFNKIECFHLLLMSNAKSNSEVQN